jgi:hypothetical protein
MTRGISKKEQRADLRRKRNHLASGLALGAKVPAKAIPISSKPRRASAGLRGVAPIGRRDK